MNRSRSAVFDALSDPPLLPSSSPGGYAKCWMGITVHQRLNRIEVGHPVKEGDIT